MTIKSKSSRHLGEISKEVVLALEPAFTEVESRIMGLEFAIDRLTRQITAMNTTLSQHLVKEATSLSMQYNYSPIRKPPKK